MSSEKKAQKTSLFRRAIERFSFRKKPASKTKKGITQETAKAEDNVIRNKDQVTNNKPEICIQPVEKHNNEHNTQTLSISKYTEECESKISKIPSENLTTFLHDNSGKSPENIFQQSKQAFIHADIKNQDPVLKNAITSKPPTPTRPSLPISARSYQPLHISQLDAALYKFKTTTAQSRENISSSRPDISQHIQRTRSLGPTER